MDRHYAAHPERYVKGALRVARPPAVVSINPDDGQTAAALLKTPQAFQISPTGQHRAAQGCYIEISADVLGEYVVQ